MCRPGTTALRWLRRRINNLVVFYLDIERDASYDSCVTRRIPFLAINVANLNHKCSEIIMECYLLMYG